MLQPKRTKFRKQQKGRNRGLAHRGSDVSFGEFGLKATTRGFITARQIEAARRAITRHVRRGGKGVGDLEHIQVERRGDDEREDQPQAPEDLAPVDRGTSECAPQTQGREQHPEQDQGQVDPRDVPENGETGEDQALLGLSLGIELPLFDRNQQAIAEAAKRREQVRTQYEAAANRALAGLEGALRSVELTTLRGDLLRNEVLPRAAESMRIARESLSAGSGDALRLLDATRSQRELQVELLDVELETRQAWSALEQAVGFPLIRFPTEATGDAATPIPEGLVAESDNTDDEGSK